MLEVDRNLAWKVFELLDAGKTPGSIAQEGLTSERTARRLKRAEQGFKAGLPDQAVSSITGWSEKKVAQIRGWWEEYTKLQIPPSLGQVWRDKHITELIYFGQRLRDLASVPLPDRVVTMTTEECEGAMWKGWPAGAVDVGSGYFPMPSSPSDTIERAVAAEWGFLRYDARKHSLFPAFHQHLASNKCWDHLDQMEAAFKGYVGSCQKTCEAIMKEVRGRQPDVSEERVTVFAESLLTYGFSRKRGGPGINFSYDVHEARQEGLPRWELKLGAWLILADDPAELELFADVHQQLRASPPYDAELTALAEAEHRVSEAAAAFQASLSPDALLRKLVLNGRCDLCP